MVSDRDKKLIELILVLVNKVKILDLNSIGLIYKNANDIFRAANNFENKDLTFNIKGYAAKIMQTSNIKEIKTILEDLEKYLNNKLTEKIIQKEKPYLDVDPDKIYKSDSYLKDCETYIEHLNQIEIIEKRILESPYYQKNLHEKIENKKRWKNYRHARLTYNLRIMYEHKNKSITFDAIITKNEFDKD